MNAPTRTLSRALALALPLLAACSEAPVSPAPIVDRTTRASSPLKGPPDHLAAIAGTVGEIQFLGLTGTAGESFTLPLRGPAPNVDSIVGAARAQIATMPRPSDARLAARRDAAAAMLDARDIAEVRRLLSGDAASLTHSSESSLAAEGGGRTQMTTIYRRGGADLLRVRLEAAPTSPRTARPLTRSPSLAVATPIGPDDPCAGLTGDPAYWPAQCVPGYDPSFDPSQVANDVAAMYASLAAANAGVAALDGDPRTNGKCASVKASYYSAVGTFAWSAAQTLFWGFRKNPAQTWTWAQRSFSALAAVNVLNVTLQECLSREF